MAKALSQLELLRAVHNVPQERLKEILCSHYCIDPAEIQRLCERRKELLGGNSNTTTTTNNNNLYLYLTIANRFGRRETFIRALMRVYGQLVETMDEKKPSISNVQSPSPGLHKQTVKERAEDTMENCKLQERLLLKEKVEGSGQQAQDLQEPYWDGESRDYYQALECNTTQSCFLDLGELCSPHTEICSEAVTTLSPEESCNSKGWECKKKTDPSSKSVSENQEDANDKEQEESSGYKMDILQTDYPRAGLLTSLLEDEIVITVKDIVEEI